MYDQDIDNDNDCFYELDNNAKSNAIQYIEAPVSYDGYCFWFSDDKKRPTLWTIDGSFNEYFSVFYVEKENAKQQQWTYFCYADYIGIPSSHQPYKKYFI